MGAMAIRLRISSCPIRQGVNNASIYLSPLLVDFQAEPFDARLEAAVDSTPAGERVDKGNHLVRIIPLRRVSLAEQNGKAQ